MKKKKRFWSYLKTLLLFGSLIIGIALSGIAALNMKLPSSSSHPDRLSESEQHLLSEITHLRTSIGTEIWPGWSEPEIPIVLFNESHVFFEGTHNAALSIGWTRIPYRSTFGSSWYLMNGEIDYYRQALPENGETPEAFVVQVGDRFAASMTTKEWTKISLVQMIKNDLPGFLKPVFPYQLFIWQFDSDRHIASVLHESFHAFQALQNYERFENAEKFNSLYDLYPWSNSDFRQFWVDERHLLAKAINEPNEEKAKSLVMDWLSVREIRRASLSEKLILYEKEREWLEGLAKYAEIKSWQLAADNEEYIPLAEMKEDPDFNFYRDGEKNYHKELRQLKSDLGFSESIFYYSGWAQAELLDRFYPNWKEIALQSDVYLEDLLLQQCVPLDCGITLK